MRREDGEFSELLFTLKPPDFMAIYCELSDESCPLDSFVSQQYLFTPSIHILTYNDIGKMLEGVRNKELPIVLRF